MRNQDGRNQIRNGAVIRLEDVDINNRKTGSRSEPGLGDEDTCCATVETINSPLNSRLSVSMDAAVFSPH